VEIREGSVEEASLLLEELNRYERKLDPFLKPMNADEIKRYLEKKVKRGKTRILVAEENGEVVGVAVCEVMKWKTTTFQNLVYVHDLFVKKEHRGRGIGKALLKEVEKWARKMEANVVVVDVYTNNPSLNFYRKLGFKEWVLKLVKKV